MWSRKRLDIRWGDLMAAAAQSFTVGERESLATEIEELWSPLGDALTCLSVRSGFDLLLAALDLPRGSEVLVSAVTIGSMLRIIEEHGFVPVPVDLDAISMSPRLDALARGRSSRTRAVLVAHLFGGRIDLRPIADFAHRHDLVLIEDAAQAYAGPGYFGHHAADVSLFSFGPIKTATALGGAIVRVRDRTLLARMRVMQAGCPLQRRSDFFARVVKYAALKAASIRIPYQAVVSACRVAGLNHDRLVNGTVRAFADRDFFIRIRQQPSAPLLALLLRRLRYFDPQRLVDRIRVAEQIMGRRRATPLFPGSACEPHLHWLLPVWTADPLRLISKLADAGFDATQGQSLTIVPPPDDHPELEPSIARQVLDGVVFLPCYPEMSMAAVERLAELVASESLPSATWAVTQPTASRVRHQAVVMPGT